MAETRVDPNSAPSNMIRAEDFLISDAFKTAGMSGRNPFSTDSTAVANMPDAPDGEGKMVAVWKYAEQMHDLANIGIHPVPSHWFDDTFNGGRPVRPASSSARIVGGKMIRDYGVEVMLFTTTPSTWRQLMANEAQLAAERKGGSGSVSKERQEFDRLLEKQGVHNYVEDKMTSQVVSVSNGGNSISRQNKPMSVSVPAGRL